MADTVLAVSSRALLQACEALGLDTGQMLQAAGLERRALEDPDARIELSRVRALWAKAYALSGDPDLALRAAEALPFGAYKVIDFLASNAPTIGAALIAIARYFPLINTAIELPIEVGPERVLFGVRAPRDPASLTRPYVEYLFAAVTLRMRIGADAGFALRAVELAFPAPARTATHERIFGCPVRFGAPASRLEIDRAVWDAKAANPNPSLFRVLDEHAKLLLERLPRTGGFANDVRAAIAGELRGGDPSLEHVAKRLAVSPRTLQRRLRDLGPSYADLLDELRRSFSTSYLAEPDVAVSEVAYLLGFAEQSSFTRAFKRWTGMTPSEYRARR